VSDLTPNIYGCLITPNTVVKNLGVTFEPGLTFDNAYPKQHLRNIPELDYMQLWL
jgi:hypothetical protein